MSGPLINALLKATAKVVAESGIEPKAGRPYAREAPLTPYEYNASVTIRFGKGKNLEFLLSMPSSVVDRAGALDHPTPLVRSKVLAEKASEIIEVAISLLGGAEQISPEKPKVVVGWDVVLPSLRTAGNRLVMPWQSNAGGFVVETGIGER